MRKIVARILAVQTKALIRHHKLNVVVITGSVGKTSTTQAIATVLGKKFKVRTTTGNYNTDIGVPCSAFGRRIPTNIKNLFAWAFMMFKNLGQIYGKVDFEMLVLEVGTDQPGDVPSFAYLKPDIAVVTAVTPEHMEFFDSIDAVAAEELSVIGFSKKVFCNDLLVDKQFIAEVIESLGERSAVIACYSRADVKYLTPKLKVVGEHSLDAIAAACAVGKALGMKKDDIDEAVQAIRPQPGRMQVLRGIKNSKLIDDTYNATPEAVKAALQYLFSQHSPQKIALLGNMNELGNSSQATHREIGQMCTPKQLDILFTLGPEANRYIAEEAEAKGCKVTRCKSPVEAGQKIKEALKEGGLVLLKGSQNGVFTEEALKQLLADPAHAHKLVRQSPQWMKMKRRQFSEI